jgi:hypothetical protein
MENRRFAQNYFYWRTVFCYCDEPLRKWKYVGCKTYTTLYELPLFHQFPKVCKSCVFYPSTRLMSQHACSMGRVQNTATSANSHCKSDTRARTIGTYDKQLQFWVLNIVGMVYLHKYMYGCVTRADECSFHVHMSLQATLIYRLHYNASVQLFQRSAQQPNKSQR